jgi:hypothetical protein
MGTLLDAQESTIKTEFNSGLERITSCSVEAFLLTALSRFCINICFTIAVNTNTFESSFSAYCLFWS